MISKRLKASLLVVLIGASLMLGVAVGFTASSDDDFFALRKNFRIFGAVYEELVTGYVKPVDPERLMRTGVEAMLSELDPYTTFLDEADNANLDIITQGQYGGVGLNIGERGGKVTVIAPVEGASGYKQGIRAGDVLTQIDEQSVEPLSMKDVQTLLRGEPGTTVQVTVERKGTPAPIDFTLMRQEIDLENVTYRGRVGEASDVGYVKLERFTRDAASEVESALQELTEAGALNGLILDLRGNPGGLLNAAVQVSELFVSKGAVIVKTKGRLPAANNTYRSERTPLVPDLPLVVLVDGFSASASEIVAGAVQDHDRGVVLGSTTYGKGLVQAIRSLPHNTSLKMTTAQYRTPSGRSIQPLDPTPLRDSSGAADPKDTTSTTGLSQSGQKHRTTHGRTVRDGDGLTPDVPVNEKDPGALEQALKRQAAFFFYANQYAASRDTLPPNFAVTDEDLADFRAWLDEENVRYPTDAERAIQKLRERFADGEHDAVQEKVSALRETVRAEKQASFQTHSAALKQHLEREIRSRFVTETQQTAARLKDDRQLEKSVELLHEEDRYQSILSPDE